MVEMKNTAEVKNKSVEKSSEWKNTLSETGEISSVINIIELFVSLKHHHPTRTVCK